MISFFNTVLYQPLFNLLIFLYEYVAFQDLGIAIIFLTIIIRIILYPLFYKSFKNQTLLQKLQPEIQKIQHDHKNDREKQAQKLMTLYQQNKVNPFTSFLLILVQLPVFIVLYQLMLKELGPEAFNDLYSFLSPPAEINNVFLGLIDLRKPHIIMVSFAVIFQYIQSRLSLPKIPQKGQLIMMLMGPILTLVILWSMSSAVGLYWATTSVFSVIQQIIINKQLRNNGGIQNNNSKTG